MKKKELKLDPKAELGRVKKLGEDFKKFISRGNVVDMAVGVVVGGAFSKIVTSLVNDVITPAIGVLLGGLDFSELSFGLKDAQINYGLFLQTIIDFLIIAACIFTVVKIFEKFKKKEEPKEEVKPEEPKKPDDILLLEEIRDLLKKKAK
mgnify:FL=1